MHQAYRPQVGHALIWIKVGAATVPDTRACHRTKAHARHRRAALRNRLQRLDRHEWPGFFHQLARDLPARRVEVEISCMLPSGDLVARSLPLYGIDCDSAADLIRIELAEFELRVERPSSVHVDGPPLTWRQMILIDGAGHAQRLHVREPLLLAATGTARSPARSEPPARA
jgi:hypothetical protein